MTSKGLWACRRYAAVPSFPIFRIYKSPFFVKPKVSNLDVSIIKSEILFRTNHFFYQFFLIHEALGMTGIPLTPLLTGSHAWEYAIDTEHNESYLLILLYFFQIMPAGQ